VYIGEYEDNNVQSNLENSVENLSFECDIGWSSLLRQMIPIFLIIYYIIKKVFGVLFRILIVFGVIVRIGSGLVWYI